MSYAKTKKEEKVVHEHSWLPSPDQSEKRCSCGCVLISLKEAKRRQAEWDKYYADVEETHAYQRYHQQLMAWHLGDKDFVKMCQEQAHEELEEVTDALGRTILEVKKEFTQLKKPSFPELSWSKYIINHETEVNPVIAYAEQLFTEGGGSLN